jgi:hypothetical protein
VNDPPMSAEPSYTFDLREVERYVAPLAPRSFVHRLAVRGLCGCRAGADGGVNLD